MKVRDRFSAIRPVIWAVACAALIAPAASAQTSLEDPPEISRDVRDLPGDVRPDPDVDSADTALVFTNFSPGRRTADCVGYDADGRAVGRIWVKIPPRGTRYARASDLADGLDFIGHVICGVRSDVVGSVVFVGAGITDLGVIQVPGEGYGRMRFPLVASF
jgi:hypothetical protein